MFPIVMIQYGIYDFKFGICLQVWESSTSKKSK